MNIIENAPLPGPDHGARVIREGRHIRVIDVEVSPIGEFACFHANRFGERLGHPRARVTKRKLLISRGNHLHAPGAAERPAPGVAHLPERQR